MSFVFCRGSLEGQVTCSSTPSDPPSQSNWSSCQQTLRTTRDNSDLIIEVQTKIHDRKLLHSILKRLEISKIYSLKLPAENQHFSRNEINLTVILFVEFRSKLERNVS